MNELDKKSITYLRVLATIFIICCHLVHIFDNSIIKASAMFFNVGVYLFLIISGYLYGKKNITHNGDYKTWIILRAKRILIPMYVFMTFLFVIFLVQGREIKIFNWIAYIFNLQGLEIYVPGAQHLWYLTISMVCYFVTIILDKYKDKFTFKKIGVFCIVYILMQVIMSYFIYKQFGGYMGLVFLYILSYMIGYYWDSNTVNIKIFICSIITIIISICVRLIGLLKLDGSIFYDIFIVKYTHSLIALGMLFSGIYLVKLLNKHLNSKFIRHIDSISYEIYLVHYMFIGGPISVLITSNTIINCIIVLLCTYLAAIVLHNICNFIYKTIDKSNKEKIQAIAD